MIIADTSGLIPYFNESDPDHDAIATWIEAKDPVMVVSPFVVAEIDYLVATRCGVNTELAVLGELARGAYELATIDAESLATAARVVERYRDLGIGINRCFPGGARRALPYPHHTHPGPKAFQRAAPPRWRSLQIDSLGGIRRGIITLQRVWGIPSGGLPARGTERPTGIEM